MYCGKKLGILNLFYEAVKVCFVVANSLYIDVNLLDGGDCGGVVTGEYLAYIAKRKLCELSYNINADMSCVCNIVGSLS